MPEIEALYPQAFPDEDLVPLVRELLSDTEVALSLVGSIDSQIAGHAIFTRCGVAGESTNVVLLGPLAVAPAFQRQGIGSALVHDGLRRARAEEWAAIFVLGDPRYYSRFGFEPETGVEPPYRLPREWETAWQSVYLSGNESPSRGKLVVPRQWQDASLWAP